MSLREWMRGSREIARELKAKKERESIREHREWLFQMHLNLVNLCAAGLISHEDHDRWEDALEELWK